MNCKKCGACCIAPSITTPIPQMPHGKPAGVRCFHLTEGNECILFGRPERPSFCLAWPPTPELCGTGLEEALKNIAALEADTAATDQGTPHPRRTLPQDGEMRSDG